MPTPTSSTLPVDELISQAYADLRRAKIDPDRAARSVDPGHIGSGNIDSINPALRDGDTIYLTTADGEGNMVSLIQSNYRGMGSGVCPEGLGFCLQDRGELFDLAPGRANTYAPGKRPFHTIIPAFITRDGKALGQLRRHGWSHATAGPRPDRHQPGGLRHEPAGSRRRPRASFIPAAASPPAR